MTGVIARIGFPRTPRSAACGITRHLAYGVESGELSAPTVLGRHRGGCLVCQATAARQRRILRELASMRNRLEPLPYDLAVGPDELRGLAISGAAERRRWSNRAGMTAKSIVSIAAIGAVVIAGRRIRSLVGGG